jgi:hypothetical protein
MSFHIQALELKKTILRDFNHSASIEDLIACEAWREQHECKDYFFTTNNEWWAQFIATKAGGSEPVYCLFRHGKYGIGPRSFLRAEWPPYRPYELLGLPTNAWLSLWIEDKKTWVLQTKENHA